MPATARVASASVLDSSAMLMRPKFAQASSTGGVSGVTGLHWKCTKLVLQAGIAPSYGLCEIPLAALDDTAPSIAGVSSSPLEGIKIGTPVQIEGITSGSQAVSLFQGYVSDLNARFGPREDTAIVEVLDARWLMEGVPVIGSFWKSASGTNGISYRQGWNAHFNAGGQPNCIYVSGVPVFCEPNYGIGDGESPADSNTGTARETKASFWTSRAVLEYLRFVTRSSTYGTYLQAKFPWLAYLADSLVTWPEEYHSAVSSGESRKVREFEVKGENILQLMEHVLKGEGAYTIVLGPDVSSSADEASSYKAQLQVIRSRYYQGDKTIKRGVGAAANVLTDVNTVNQGSLRFSGRNLFTKFAGAGALTFIEQRLTSATGANTDPLKRAWSDADQDLAEEFYRTRRNAGDTPAEALEKMYKQYPNVFGAYRINDEYDFQSSTSESVFPRAQVGRPVLGELLSSYLENSSGTGNYDKLRFRRPVLFEYKQSSTWKLALAGDAMRRYADGTITLSAMQEAGQTHDAPSETGSSPSISAVTINPRQLRVSLGIPCDHRLLAAYRLASDTSSSVPVLRPSADDADRIHKNFTRLYYIESELYGKELRRGSGDSQGSYPTPEAASGTIASNKDGDNDGALRDDTTLLQAHVQKRADDVGRIERGGTLVIPHVTFAWQPGMSLHALKNTTGGDYALRSMLWQVTIEADSKVNRTTLSLR